MVDHSSGARDVPQRNTGGGKLNPGDRVIVRPLVEIQRTLDTNGKLGGLKVMDGMAAHCGKEYVVLKRVRMIFDERQWKMVRLKDTVILKDVICDGQGMYEKEGCDRCCYFFWKERWLRKIP
jgi:hypothetical protein